MEESKKRKSEASNGDNAQRKSKPWRVPRKGQPNYVNPTIEPGDSGIWATCELGKEGKSTAELRDLFEEYAKKLYGSLEEQADGEDSNEDVEADIEAEIKKEVQGMKSRVTKKETLFQSVKMDIQCVLFFKTRPPVEPVSFVHTICKDAAEGATQRARFVKRLSPMAMMGKATEDGLAKVADAVLGPVFHVEEDGLKFAIRPTRRNHNIMKRDDIIKQIAKAVGGDHKVDLKGYNRLILVDVYRNILGMSVVGSDYDELKQYNLAEIYDPTPKLKAKTSIGAAPEVKDKDDKPPSDVAPNGHGPKDDVIPMEKSEDDKTSLDSQKAADDAHLTAL
ncbi:hypothetical protein HO173_006271 [Letharia columbiana]|uniref:THUMP domain-containing protein n=1 Tax=Letharia columbiana TaxID=112416 RepID=A0A8H6FVM2_9LECA|nr:uncharacterized protein HO173_006271 [Letharia columbiana]KAF6235588.1 hypothetical protein HO173_006271 [Letharia columbiana]